MACGIVDRDRAVRLDDAAAAVGVLPLQRVAGQTLVGVALPDEAAEARVVGALAVLDRLSLLLELGPGLRRVLEAVLLEEIAAVVEETGVGVPRHADQRAVDRVVFDDCREVQRRQLRERRVEIDGVLGHDARPDDVDLIDVVVRRLGAELLVVDGQAVGCALFARDEFGVDPGGLAELARSPLPAMAGLGGPTRSGPRGPAPPQGRCAAFGHDDRPARVPAPPAWPPAPSRCGSGRRDHADDWSAQAQRHAAPHDLAARSLAGQTLRDQAADGARARVVLGTVVPPSNDDRPDDVVRRAFTHGVSFRRRA